MIRLLLLSFLIVTLITGLMWGEERAEVLLPKPVLDGGISVEKAISVRRSTRSFKDEALTLEEVGQLLWAAQGITEEGGFKRAAPSAGALYPMEVYLIAGEVIGLNPGLYHYKVKDHSVEKLKTGDLRTKFENATINQGMVTEAPITIILTGIYQRTTRKYGDRGVRYVYIEAGHIGQNICLQAEALGLGTTTVGAFYDEKIKAFLERDGEEPLYVLPVGIKP